MYSVVEIKVHLLKHFISLLGELLGELLLVLLRHYVSEGCHFNSYIYLTAIIKKETYESSYITMHFQRLNQL